MSLFRIIFIGFSVVTLALILMAYIDTEEQGQRIVQGIPEAPEIEVPEFEVPELPLTGIDLIDRAIQFGEDSNAVMSALQNEFYTVLEMNDGDQNAAIFALIDATRAVDKITDQIRLAEIRHLQNAVDGIRDEVQRYRDTVAAQIASESRLSMVEILALLFAGVQCIAAVVALFLTQRT